MIELVRTQKTTGDILWFVICYTDIRYNTPEEKENGKVLIIETEIFLWWNSSFSLA